MRGKLLVALVLGTLPSLVGGGGAPLSPSGARADGYEGVAPGSNVVPEGIAAKPGGAALVTWPGFQVLPSGGSRVFIQTNVQVKSELKRDGSAWQLILKGVSLPAGNARRPLDTSFFNTPVASVRSKQHKRDVVVTLKMRTGVQPTLRTELAATGYYFVYLDFPPGNFESRMRRSGLPRGSLA